MQRSVLAIWKSLAGRPGGKRVCSWLVGRKAPYFASIHPRFVELRPGCRAVGMRFSDAVGAGC